MPEYTMLAVLAVLATVAAEHWWLRTGLFRSPSYWITMGICLFFMIWVNGWLTKLSAPIVRYYEPFFLGVRFPWDIPVEDFLFGFAVINTALLGWLWPDRRRRVRRPDVPTP
ncbi:MAG: lycopene cyclase domain-containing protein [Acidimicrobiia bacterium]